MPAWFSFGEHLIDAMSLYLDYDGWVTGDGRYGSFSNCPLAPTLVLFSDVEKARKAVAEIDKYGCGSKCMKDHHILDLAKLATTYSSDGYNMNDAYLPK